MKQENLRDAIRIVLDSWAQIAIRNQEAVDRLQSVYKAIFDEPIKRNCGDCYFKAYKKIEKFVYLHTDKINNEIIMSDLKKDRKYLLKEGLVLQVGLGGDSFTNENLTDEIGASILANNPNFVKHFERFPTDDKGELAIEGVKAKKAKAVKADDKKAKAEKVEAKAEVKLITHIVTEEDLTNNPDLVKDGVLVGDEIQIPSE